MEKIIDLSKGYLPVVLVVAMLAACVTASYWMSAMSSGMGYNTAEISKIRETLEVLPGMTTDIALIKYELGIGDSDATTAMVPFLKK